MLLTARITKQNTTFGTCAASKLLFLNRSVQIFHTSSVTNRMNSNATLCTTNKNSTMKEGASPGNSFSSVRILCSSTTVIFRNVVPSFRICHFFLGQRLTHHRNPLFPPCAVFLAFFSNPFRVFSPIVLHPFFVFRNPFEEVRESFLVPFTKRNANTARMA